LGFCPQGSTKPSNQGRPSWEASFASPHYFMLYSEAWSFGGLDAPLEALSLQQRIEKIWSIFMDYYTIFKYLPQQ
jgi:hypothetical protein